MSQLANSSLLHAQRLMLELYRITEVGELRRAIPEMASKLISSDRANFNEFDVARGSRLIVPSPIPAYWTRLSPILLQHMHEHPIGVRERAPPEHRAFTFYDRRRDPRWKRSVLYHEYYVPAGARDQLFVLLCQRGTVRFSLAFNRSKTGFTESERALLELISPHVACAWQNAVAMSELRSRAALTPSHLSSSTELADHSLTDREREVFHWLAEGKRNAEIAMILGISPRTVGKHLEHLFEKLGVETRTAAVRSALRSRA